MGYVKLKKDGRNFDILSAENVGSIKLAGSGTPVAIEVTYLMAGSSAADKQIMTTITPPGATIATNFVQEDVDNLNDAVGKIGGGMGMINVSLSQPVSSIAVGETA